MWVIAIERVIGLSLVALILAAIITDAKERKNFNNPWTTSGKLLVAVLVIWSVAILIDVFWAKGYTFTVIKGIKMGKPE